MRVLVTGGTGFVGAHTVVALLAAGHQPRLLVRRPARLATTLGAIGLDIESLDVVVGDMVDPGAVARAAAGTDAAIHAAAVVGALDRRVAKASLETNVLGTQIVIDAAIAAGCDPVVHVSSIAAVFSPSVPVIHADLPPVTTAANPYTRSKALAEELARDRQDAGRPVVIVSPGGVFGPPIGEVYGDAAAGFATMLKHGFLPLRDGAIGAIDARDLAEVLVATLRPGLAGRRFMAGGNLVSLAEVAEIIRRLTGRRFPVYGVPAGVFRGLGRALDGLRKVVPFDSVYTGEAMQLLTKARPTDDSAVHDELGISYRDPAVSIEASLRGMYASGVLNAKQVGQLAEVPG
jgi:nucleoside-diphosphate-sugar epimerase